jgi:transitional endoplasmic reticulum ATPase
MLRAGRFDLVLQLDAPDAATRAQILAVQMRDRPLAPGADLADLAARTEGWTGADLAALAEDAARMAFRRAVTDGIAPDAAVLTPRDLHDALARQASRRAAAPGKTENA